MGPGSEPRHKGPGSEPRHITWVLVLNQDPCALVLNDMPGTLEMKEWNAGRLSGSQSERVQKQGTHTHTHTHTHTFEFLYWITIRDINHKNPILIRVNAVQCKRSCSQCPLGLYGRSIGYGYR